MFVWVDLATPDAEASARFYGELFGWTATEPNEDFGGYQNFSHEARLVAGLTPMGGPIWMSHIGVEDCDAAAKAVADNGGKVLYEPMDVGDLGRLAICEDPGQAPFGLWQPGRHTGTEKRGTPVSLTWCERLGGGLDEAVAFYTSVFGWSADTQEMAGVDYTVFTKGGPVAGAAASDADPHWLVWFEVADVDAVVERATGLGAALEAGPADIPGVGRTAIVTDPHGARFGVLASETPDE
jgi:predicted enzyme related to lactoylglutathione lyase